MKPSRRILSVLLCLVLSISLFAGLALPSAARGNQTVMDDELPIVPIESLPKIIGYSISLKGQIDVNFYLTIPYTLFKTGTFTLNGEKVTPVPCDKGYQLTLALPAKEMNREVVLKAFRANGSQIQITENGKNVWQCVYSVQQYLGQVIQNPGDLYAPSLVELCQAMSDYGSYTQKFFGYDVEHAVDPYFPEEVEALTVSGCELDIGEGTESIGFYGCSLLTRSETALRLYFRIKGELEEFGASIDGVETEVHDAGKGYLYIELDNISAKDLANVHSFTVTKGDESLTVGNCSAYSYVQRVLESEKEDSLKMAAKALKRYGDLAKTYFEQQSGS